MKHLILIFLIFIVEICNAAVPFKFIVSKDGTGDFTSIQAAINACADNERSIIFVKKGVYNEQIALGAKSSASLKKISLIGESYGDVIISHNQYRASSGSPTFEDICTVKLYANDFYAENITIQNTATAGMAEALYTAGDRQTFKNCRILGYQDTYRSKKGTRAYFLNCFIEGAIDFIYAGGTVFFDNCTINCVAGGGYIVAPEDAYKFIAATSTASVKKLNLEFIFRNCSLTANNNVMNSSYSLGRPWNVDCGAYYLNCKMGPHIKPAGWATMDGNETSASFGEYNSMDLEGNTLNVANRVSWSFQLAKQDVETLLTPTYVYGLLSTTPYNPELLCNAPSKPVFSITDNTLNWEAVAGAVGYLIYKNGAFLTATDATTFDTLNDDNAVYSIKSTNSLGVLSEHAFLLTSHATTVTNPDYTLTNKTVFFSNNTNASVFSVDGKCIFRANNISQLSLKSLQAGVYILCFANEFQNTLKNRMIILN